MSLLRSEATDRLFRAILLLKTVDECYDFFDDLCTVKEILDMSQRFSSALLLDEGVSYQKIAGSVGLSTATISRVSRCLNYGSGGYRAAIDRLREAEGAEDGQM